MVQPHLLPDDHRVLGPQAHPRATCPGSTPTTPTPRSATPPATPSTTSTKAAATGPSTPPMPPPTGTSQAVVTRLSSLTDAERLIHAGIPVITSQSFLKPELDGAGYGTAGHLMTVIGFTEDGDVIANDPASPDNAAVRHVYKRRQFENIWLRTKRHERKRQGHGRFAEGSVTCTSRRGRRRCRGGRWPRSEFAEVRRRAPIGRRSGPSCTAGPPTAQVQRPDHRFRAPFGSQRPSGDCRALREPVRRPGGTTFPPHVLEPPRGDRPCTQQSDGTTE